VVPSSDCPGGKVVGVASTEPGAAPAGGGLSRRSLLARAAVAGGVVWAAPSIASSPAYADKGDPKKKGTEVPCTRFYAVRMTTHETVPIDDDKKEDKHPLCPDISTFIREHPDIPIQFPPQSEFPQLLASQDNFDWAVMLPAGVIPGDPAYNARLIMSFGTAGNVCCPGYTDPNPPDPTQAGRRILFPQCSSTPISSVQIIYCIP